MLSTFAYWQNALRGSFAPIHENDPQPGYYRTKPGRKEPSAAVAIWREPDGIKALRNGRAVDPCAVWTWCCMHPVTYETYVAVAERGEPWPEDIEIPGIGHNGGPDHGAGDPGRHPASDLPRSPEETVRLKISVLWEAASGWMSSIGSVSSQVEADRAANYAEAFSALEREAEDARTSEKKPVLEQGRAIDAKWKPVVAAADEAKRAMKKALEPFLIAEAKRLQEASTFGPIGETAKAGTNGRRIALRRSKRVSVSDRNAFIAHYRRDSRVWDDEAVQKVLLRLAEADFAAGRRVPGAELVEDQVAA